MKKTLIALVAAVATICLSNVYPAGAQNLSGTYLYAQRDTCDLFFDVYEPTEGSELTFQDMKKPTLLFVYGGGFVGGFRSTRGISPGSRSSMTTATRSLPLTTASASRESL